MNKKEMEKKREEVKKYINDNHEKDVKVENEEKREFVKNFAIFSTANWAYLIMTKKTRKLCWHLQRMTRV
jgi:hypothetical protein